uniref:molybdopterin-binding protein n=1 Tax=Tahibacter caeni TaxID=1453545 RepID=UPI002148A113
LPAGCRIGPAQLALLAGMGCATVDVVQAPRLALFCTGRELVDDAALPLGSAGIRNSNGPYLAAAVAAAGAVLLREATLPDEPATLYEAVTGAVAAGARLILSTGAVSAGRYDFVPEVLHALRAEIVFHKLSMRPGKPLLFARLPGGALYFGLPGNPASCAVGFRFFVCAALRALLGLGAERPWRLPLLQDADKKAGFTQYQKAGLTFDRDGRAGVRLLQGQESFKLRSLAQAQGWAVLPAAAQRLPAGTPVDFHGNAHWGLQLDTENGA